MVTYLRWAVVETKHVAASEKRHGDFGPRSTHRNQDPVARTAHGREDPEPKPSVDFGAVDYLHNAVASTHTQGEAVRASGWESLSLCILDEQD